MASTKRDYCGRFAKYQTGSKRGRPVSTSNATEDHGYASIGHNDYEVRTSVKKGSDSWKTGRRVVEFGELLKNLQSCKRCRMGPVPLTIYNVVGELKKGLSGYLYVQCTFSECGFVNCVAFGKTHRLKKRGMPCFAVNTKLGTAMIDNIGGANRVNNFISTLNINPISNPSLKKIERRAGYFVEKVAKQSCASAAHQAFEHELDDVANLESQEVEAAMVDFVPDLGVASFPDSSPNTRKLLCPPDVKESDGEWTDVEENSDSPPDASMKARPRKVIGSSPMKSRKRLSFLCKKRHGMTCAVDTAWQKKGFDSLTAHTFFMSKAVYGKKVLKAIVSHRTCGTCKWWKRNKPTQSVRDHRCVHTHVGSAKSMESTSGEQGVRELLAQGTPVEIIEGDGDNTLISRIKKNMNIDLKKKFDKNHIVKNIGSSLYALHNKKGVKLSKSVIQHLQKCLKYAFSKNKGDPELMKENLAAIVPHQFGDHSLCRERFCGSLRHPNIKYIHKGLPYKVPLQDITLRTELEQLFAPIINNYEQYCDLGSSQQCEHANREVSLRAPKSHHYGNSEALDFRVHATAAFINEGRDYITQVHKEAGISPGAYTKKHAENCAKQRKRLQERSELPSSKRRRLILKQERAITQVASEALEGQTYKSGIGHNAAVDIEQIPEAVPRGTFQPLQKVCGPMSLLTFDLETTDLIHGSDIPGITQMAAFHQVTGQSFCRFILPTQPISLSAQQVTGISVRGNKLFQFGKEVVASSLSEALTDFLNWLELFPNTILIAHNGRRFDFPIFCSAIEKCDLKDRFSSCVVGCVDSLPLFKKAYPDMPSYKQEDLVKQVLQTSYGAHDALEDVKALGNLVQNACNKPEAVLPFSFAPKCVFHSICFKNEKCRNLPSLNILVSSGVCKRPTVENIAGSGLNLQHLRTIFERQGEDGLRNTFIVKNCEGQPRVTGAVRTLDTVIPKLVDFLQR